MVKKKLSKKQRAAKLRAKALRLEAEILEQEDEDEQGDEYEESDEGEDEEDDDVEEDVENHAVQRRDQGGSMLDTVGGIEGVVGALGNFAQLMGGMHVEDETRPDKHGNTVKFTRPGGRVRNVRLDKSGNVESVDYQTEEWPPRGEGF